MTTKKNSNITASQTSSSFTEGGILLPLIRFALPVLLALFLQAMYGAVDLLVVGKFASSADVSAVSTGSQLLATITSVIASFSMGTTIILGQQIGRGEGSKGGDTIGASIVLFAIIGVLLSAFMILGAPLLANIMNAPEEAFSQTVAYIRICGVGILVIIAYNMIGSIFRGIGDSTTPLITVSIACICNIAGDLFLVDVCHLGAAGAAIATVGAQAVSVILSLILIRRKDLPFSLHRSQLRFVPSIVGRVASLGSPIALQDFLVGLSFLILLAIINALGLTASAGIGVAEKVAAFIMLMPSAFMQSLAAFVAQNYGAGRLERGEKALHYAIGMSLVLGVAISWLTACHGDLLAGIFTNDPAVVAAAWDYLKAYAIDCVLTPIFFCYIGFFNGVGRTRFVMIQGLIGAFCVRVPVAFLMSRIQPVTLFRIGLSTPCSSTVQIALCLVYMLMIRKSFAAVRNSSESTDSGSFTSK